MATSIIPTTATEVYGRRGVHARFDDPRPGGRNLQFGPPLEELRAETISDVPAVITAAERAREAGRWVAGYVAYEAAPAFDPALVTRPPVPGLPLAWFGVHRTPRRRSGWPTRQDYAVADWVPDTDPDGYRAGLERILHHIRIGNTYQTNFTLRLRSTVTGDAVAFYRDMVEAQWAGYAAMLETDNHLILSASPELFFEWDGRQILTRPMKGTLARGRWPAEDAARRQALLDSDKIRAENVMIVDLLRSDLGRIAAVGSVAVDELFTAEPYPTVWQLTSTVRADTKPGTALVDIFAAMFPCGSVTGAPKASTMEIIAHEERAPRGVYCGAIGVLAPDGSGHPAAVFNVAIRTVTIDKHTGAAAYGTGGGIVADSDTDDEYREALLKTEVLAARRPPVGLIETMVWTPADGIRRRDRHLERLLGSASVLSIPVAAHQIEVGLSQIEADGPRMVRLVVDYLGRPGIDVRPLPARRPEPVLLAIDGPVAGSIAGELVDPAEPLVYHKTTNRGRYEAAAARHPEADDVVLVNRAGECTETTVANLVARVGGRWVTPPIEAGLIPGTYRAELLEAGEIVEEPISVETLRAADAVAVINSVRGWRPALIL